MDEISTSRTAAGRSTDRPADGRTGTDDVAAPAQPSLPIVGFEDDADEPIGYSLTARARRAVVPDELPALRVVDAGAPYDGGAPDDADLEQPGDTRPSRARALRRAGATFSEIAAELEVEELVVRAWVGAVGARRPRRTVRRDAVAPSPSTDDERRDTDRRAGFALARAAAAAEIEHRLGDPSFASGLGVVSAVLTTDEHAATLRTERLEVAAAAVRWLQHHAGVAPTELRVVLRLGPDIAGDLARHRWAKALDLPTERVLHARWRGAPAGDAVEALVRVPDGTVAATLAGWSDALLAGGGPQLPDTGWS